MLKQQASPTFPIHYWHDDNLLAAHKPSGLLVHRSAISSDRISLVGLLREQTKLSLHPIHRLDRATSGIILFGKNPEITAQLGSIFRERQVNKAYLAVVRGWIEEAGLIDKSIKTIKNDGPLRRVEAQTYYEPLQRIELPLPCGRYETTRLTLLLVKPHTGRRHQIRIHMEKLSHPIIGDTTYGDSRHNYLFRDHFDSNRLLLHSFALGMEHPLTEEQIGLFAPPMESITGLFNDFDKEALQERLEEEWNIQTSYSVASSIDSVGTGLQEE